MHKRIAIASYRASLAILTSLAVWQQFHAGTRLIHFQAINFFSFFTIESNILACMAFLLGAFFILRYKQPAWFDQLRGAITVYMVTTGLVYAVLLSGNEVALQTTLPWVNTIVHQVMPIAVLADWIVMRPKQRITQKQLLAWLLFPVVYVNYSLLRGPHAQWYPYPFLDPRPHGYLMVLAYSIGIAIAITALAYLVRAIGNRRTRF